MPPINLRYRLALWAFKRNIRAVIGHYTTNADKYSSGFMLDMGYLARQILEKKSNDPVELVIDFEEMLGRSAQESQKTRAMSFLYHEFVTTMYKYNIEI